MLADGAVDPMPWSDYAQVLVQLSIFAVVCWGGAWLVLDVARRWSISRRVERDLDDREHTAWISTIKAELEDSRATLDTPGSAWSVSGVLSPAAPRNSYQTPCADCRHDLEVHDEMGRCTDVGCLALGSDQVCPSATTALRRLDHRLPRPNWSSPSGWVLFCRLCGHRMAHHATERSGAYECPPGPQGPFHDGPAAS